MILTMTPRNIREPLLLVCDIDGTLFLPEQGSPGLEAFNRFVGEHRGRVIFAVNTGRSLPGIAAVAENGPLARPEWLIANVGSELYNGFAPETLDEEWCRLTRRDWPRERCRILLAGCPGLADQEPENQGPGKLSYYFRQPPEQVLPEVRRRLGDLAAMVKITDCLGIYLDITPLHGGKGAATAFLARRLGIPENRVIVAGDSGNDRDMLTGPWRGIVPANYSDDLADLAGETHLYFASGTGAEGVMEGLLALKEFS